MARSRIIWNGGPPYTFRPATRADLPMLCRWLCAPEVARWWGDPDAEAALLEADLDEPRMTMLVAAHRGRPFAYAQHYDVHAWPQPHFADLPPGAGDPAANNQRARRAYWKAGFRGDSIVEAAAGPAALMIFAR